MSQKKKKSIKKGKNKDVRDDKRVNTSHKVKNRVKKRKKVSFLDEINANFLDEIGVKKRGIHKIGTLRKHKKGFGFVVLEKPDKDSYNEDEYSDIFVGKFNMQGAMNGDIVDVEVYPDSFSRKNPEGRVHKIIERGIKTVVGRVEIYGKFGFVIPEGKTLSEDIFIPGRLLGGAKTGDYVVAKITKYPDKENKAEGKIIEILGKQGQAGADILAVIKGAGLDKEFPKEVQAEADSISDVIDSKDLVGRRDLRELFTVTIDGADSKDFDDAVSIEVNDNGNWILGVHIADVSHYVGQNKPLDREAFERGNSVYLINQVVPMLPEKLSNGICSLNPGVDRLTLTCQMEISKEGKVLNHEIYESVINSHKRLVYDDVSDILENKVVTKENEYLFEMEKLARVLMTRKNARGAIDFNVDEPIITLNKKGHAIDIRPANRRIASKIIEEFMLLCNETVAEHFFWLNVPFIFRVHEKPSLANIQDLKTFLNGFSIKLRGDASDVKPSYLANILAETEGKQYENIVNNVILRSMQKAYYDVECNGHFGLALKYYCHFTSPIRRYPDLLIHRIIKMIIHNKLSDKLIGKMERLCEAAAENSSNTERMAIELEREVEKMKMAEYLHEHIGEEFDGIICGVTKFGIYVALDNCIEGLVRIDSITDDFYNVDTENYRIIGVSTGKVYALGDSVRIKVLNVNVKDREIDFVLAC